MDIFFQKVIHGYPTCIHGYPTWPGRALHQRRGAPSRTLSPAAGPVPAGATVTATGTVTRDLRLCRRARAPGPAGATDSEEPPQLEPHIQGPGPD